MFVRICPRFLQLSAEYAEFPTSDSGNFFSKEFLDAAPCPDDFSKFNDDFFVQRYVSGYIFTMIRSVGFIWSC